MTALRIGDPQGFTGSMIIDERGEEIGTAAGVYLDKSTKEPAWAAVERTGFGLTVVPLVGATMTPEGVQVGYEVGRVEESPYWQTSLAQALSEKDEAELYEHYGLRPSSPRRVADESTDPATRMARNDVGEDSQALAEAADDARQLTVAARKKASGVTQDVATQARNLVDEARALLEERAAVEAERLVESLRRFAERAHKLAQAASAGPDPLADFVERTATSFDRLADEVEARGSEGLVDELRQVARRRPALFVAGAAVVGFGVGRILRSGGQDDVQDDTGAAGPGPARSRTREVG